MAGAAVSGWTVVTAARLGAALPVIAGMLGNVAVDALLGAVPLLGDVFDVVFRANRRNVELLEAHVDDPGGTLRQSRLVVWGAAAGVVGLLAALAVGVTCLAGTAWAVLRG